MIAQDQAHQSRQQPIPAPAKITPAMLQIVMSSPHQTDRSLEACLSARPIALGLSGACGRAAAYWSHGTV